MTGEARGDVASLDDAKLTAAVAQLERQLVDRRAGISPARWREFWKGLGAGLGAGLIVVIAFLLLVTGALGNSGMGGG